MSKFRAWRRPVRSVLCILGFCEEFLEILPEIRRADHGGSVGLRRETAASPVQSLVEATTTAASCELCDLAQTDRLACIPSCTRSRWKLSRAFAGKGAVVYRSISLLSIAAVLGTSCQFAFAESDLIVTGAMNVPAARASSGGTMMRSVATRADGRVVMIVRPVPLPPIRPCNLRTALMSGSNG